MRECSVAIGTLRSISIVKFELPTAAFFSYLASYLAMLPTVALFRYLDFQLLNLSFTRMACYK